jgi:hypothetical protein
MLNKQRLAVILHGNKFCIPFALYVMKSLISFKKIMQFKAFTVAYLFGNTRKSSVLKFNLAAHGRQ